MNDKEYPFKELNKSLKELREKDQILVQENMTAEIFSSADVVVIAISSLLTYKEMIVVREWCLTSCNRLEQVWNFEKNFSIQHK